MKINCRARRGAAILFASILVASCTPFARSVTLKAPGGEWIRHGESVAISADGLVMVVGSPKADSSRGEMTVYSRSRDDGAWDVVKTIDGVAQLEGQRFGASVDVSATGDVIVVGAPGGVTVDGKAYIYTKVGTVWQLAKTLGVTTGLFGSAVSVSDDGMTIAVAAPDLRTVQLGNSYYGAVKLWELKSGSWQSTQTVTYRDAGSEGKKFDFGASLDLSASGSTLAVGMPSWVTSTEIGDVAEGRVVVFDRDPKLGWATYTSQVVEDLERSANVYGNRAGKSFGTSVALNDSGEFLAVGARTYGETANAGAVFLFNESEGSWVLRAKDSRNYAGALGGYSVAIDSGGTQLLVGAPGYASGKGLAVYYTYANGTLTPVNYQLGKSVGTGGALGISVSMDGRGEVMAAGAPEARKNTYGYPEFGEVATFDRFTVPGEVIVRSMFSRQERLFVTWRQPDGNLGLNNEYVATLEPTGERCVTSLTSCGFANLSNGREYTVYVYAKNAVGVGPNGAPFGPYVMGSDVIVENQTAPPADGSTANPSGGGSTSNPAGGGSNPEQIAAISLPGVPPGVKVKAGYRTATVTWNAPTDGGDPVTYEVTATPGKKKCVTTGETSCRFNRLATNRAYRFSVVAVNLAGPGASSPATAKRFTQPKVSLRNSATGASIARFATLKVAKTSRVRLAVVGKASSRVCASNGSTVRGLSAGQCRVKVSVTTGARTRAKTLTLTVIS